MRLRRLRTIPSIPDGKPSSGEGKSLTNQPSAEEVYSLVIVSRDQPELWHALARQFAGNPRVQILQDRRSWERRQRIQTDAPDRRGPDRRRPLSPERDLRYRHYFIVRPDERALEG